MTDLHHARQSIVDLLAERSNALLVDEVGRKMAEYAVRQAFPTATVEARDGYVVYAEPIDSLTDEERAARYMPRFGAFIPRELAEERGVVFNHTDPEPSPPLSVESVKAAYDKVMSSLSASERFALEIRRRWLSPFLYFLPPGMR